MCSLATRTFHGPAAPTQVRGFCTAHLQQGLSDTTAGSQAVADAALVVCELATNAVNSASSAVVVTVELHRTHIYLAVRDDAPGEPVVQHPAADDPNGRGLLIVEATARSWGVQTLPNGKRVWAIVAVPESATTGMDCIVSSLV
jgi:anti-sigma regulatory factor (Ser/Thr protein kinase)